MLWIEIICFILLHMLQFGFPVAMWFESAPTIDLKLADFHEILRSLINISKCRWTSFKDTFERLQEVNCPPYQTHCSISDNS